MDFASVVSQDLRHWAGVARADGSRLCAAVAAGASELADLLLEWTTWGLISFPMLQKAAAATKRDGLRHPDIIRLDLLTQQRKQLLPKTSQISILIVPSRGERKVTWIKHPIIYPRVDFHFMHKEYPVVWEKLLRGCGPHLFWDKAPPDDPRLVGHPVRGMEGYRERVVPLVLHGDMGPTTLLTATRSRLCSGASWAARAPARLGTVYS